MARGGISVYVPRNEALMGNVGTTGNPYGTGNRAEVTAANKALQSGDADVLQALARVQNAGGGTLIIRASQVGDLLQKTPLGVMVAKDGSIVVQDTRFGGKKDAFTILNPDGSVEKKTGGTVTVGPQGVESIKFGGGSPFVVARTKVDITKNQKDGIISVALPPNLRGAAFDKDGNLNGWKINPKAIPDKAVRAWLYQNMAKDGTLRFAADSPVGQKLSALLSKAGYGRSNIGAVNEVFRAEPTARYVAGQKAAERAAKQQLENEAIG
jgi:hypothetical protein